MCPTTRVGLAVLLCAAHAFTATAAVRPDKPTDGGPKELPSFFPPATSVELQLQCGAPTGATNVNVFASLDGSGLADLARVTGQKRLAMISNGREQVLLRDDGVVPDERAGDGRFSFSTTLDLAELRQRALGEARAAAGGALSDVTVFEQRAATGKTSIEPFDFERFMACQTVPIEMIPVALGPAGGGNLDFLFTLGFSVFTTLAEPMAYSGSALLNLDYVHEPCDPEAGNPDGPWTFKTFMSQMAGSTDPATFVEHWLELYTADQTSAATNGFTVPSVSNAEQFIDDWKSLSGDGTLDLDQAPFRLMAITPRMDLRQGAGGYGSPPGPDPNGGELRFIFGAVHPLNCQPLDFSVIFEYGVPLTSCTEIRQWARDWLALTDLALEDEDAYLDALQALTDSITLAGSDPSKPNGNALNQLRSNEISLGSQIAWRIREYHLEGSGLLEQATTAETPDMGFGGAPGAYFDALVEDDTITSIPLTYGPDPLPSVAFLGAEARVAFTSPLTWGSNGSIDYTSNPDLALRRHELALNTCNGCHSTETNTDFAHMLDPQPLGFETATLSGFLVGGGQDVPEEDVFHDVTPPLAAPAQQFFDLQRRLQDMQSLANSLCGPVIAFDMLAAPVPPASH